ncbi:uncharacterized protein LOC134770479 isoform X2 [Penaeus indicus]|uniref:uncharacterized protein LOC134770479 isoform X2 n=1 Tax=Penaeus indicus TaxID=29960 RepID=UPI00300D0CD4
MATRLRNLLVLVFLSATCVRAEEELDYTNMEESEKTILTVADADRLMELILTFGGSATFVYGVYTLLHIIFGPLFIGRRRRSISASLFEVLPGRLGWAAGDPDGKGILGRALSSIDLMDVTFGVMDVEEETCRRRAVCELQRAASRMPFLGTFLQNISPSIKGMEKYKEAQQSGSALEDCKFLFECPYSFLETN